MRFYRISAYTILQSPKMKTNKPAPNRAVSEDWLCLVKGGLPTMETSKI